MLPAGLYGTAKGVMILVDIQVRFLRNLFHEENDVGQAGRAL